MKTINLTKNKHTIVDDYMFDFLNQFKWQYDNNGYAIRGFYRDDGTHGLIRMHHCVIGYPLHKSQVDHIDGNKLNNQRSNLRIINNRQNQLNSHRHRNGHLAGTSKLIVNGHTYWQSSIQINNRRHFLGNFKTQEEAYQKYLSALAQL